MVSRLALYLLGPPRIERDGLPIKVDTRKAIALLAYIAVTGESHRRASLINLLWPEYDHPVAGPLCAEPSMPSEKPLPAPAWTLTGR